MYSLGIRRVLDWDRSLSEYDKQIIIGDILPIVEKHYNDNGTIEEMVKLVTDYVINVKSVGKHKD